MREEAVLRKKVRTASREVSMLIKGGVQINDLLWYHLSKERPGELGIHLFTADIESSFSDVKQFILRYKQGLRELAERMKKDPKLAHVTQVSAWSKIVYERGGLLQMMGFELGERDEDKKEALALMTREKFLEKYGKSS